MKERKSIKNKAINSLITAIEHNPEHFLEIKIKNRVIKPCARCFGKFLGIAVSLVISLLFIFNYLKIDFKTAFILSWILSIPAIIDWSSVKLGFRKGNNIARVITGFLLGCGIVTYLVIMPATIQFKLVTFLLYELVFSVIYIHTKFGLNNAIKCLINQVKAKPIYSCECGWGCCCPCMEGCFGGCMNACLCMCLACLTIPFCCLFSRFAIGKKS